MSNLNYLYTSIQITNNTPLESNWLETEIGETVICDINVESITGEPTTANLAVKFQVAPLQFNGFSINTETSGVLRQFKDVSASGLFPDALPDGDWPASICNAAGGGSNQPHTNRIIMPGNFRILRIVLTPTIAEGTSPIMKVTASFAQNRLLQFPG